MFVNRRAFLAAGSAAAAGAILATPAAAQKLVGIPLTTNPKGHRQIYRLSLRGRRGSQFAKRYNARMRFATKETADRHRAHPGDNSRIVPLTVSIEEYQRLFTRRRSLIADLSVLTK